MGNNLSLTTNARHLVALLNQYPELMTNISPPKDSTELTKKPKPGEKIHSPKKSYKRSIDYEAVDLKTDLERALGNRDYEEIARTYYTLAYLLNY